MSELYRGIIAELAANIRQAGFRPFVADNGTYGFYTDAAGSRVVSFGVDLGRVRFSGNYKTSAPLLTGTGWMIADNSRDFSGMFASAPPDWATRGAKWRYTTLAEHLATYQSSSRYTEQ